MEIQLSKSEYTALMEIRGVPDSVQEMRYGAKVIGNKWEIIAGNDDFDELLSLISEELCYGLCSKRNISPLLRICKKVDPSSLDWIGM